MKRTNEKTRSLSSYLPQHPLASLREEFDDVMERMFGSDDRWGHGHNSPQLDLSETDNAIEAKLDLPEMDPAEIDVKVSGNVLTVSGERKEEDEEKGRTFYRMERRRGSFSRSINLPVEVNEDEAAADYQDGVLTITLPKSDATKSHKIRVGNG